MVSFFGTQTKGLLFLVPLEVALQDHHASVFDDVHEHPLAQQLLNPAVDDQVELALVAPPHEGQLPALLAFHFFILNLLLWVFLQVEAIGPDDRDVGGGADVEGTRVHLFVRAFLSARDLQQPQQRKGLEYATTHCLPILVKYNQPLSALYHINDYMRIIDLFNEQ